MLWLLYVFLIYWILIEFLNRKGILEKYGMKNYGPILMIRTKKGLNAVEKISRAKKFWKVIADLGLPAVFFGMAFMLVLVIVVDYIMIVSPPQPSELTSVQAALLIPGVNPFIPLVWGIIGLIVTLVVHEFAHAILCRVEGIKVKSLGVILALVPIGAFAEPDEGELFDKKTKRISRIRVFSIGVISNFIVALLAFLAFFQGLSLLNPTNAVVDDNGKFIGRVVEINGFEVKNGIEDLIKPNQMNSLVLENDSGKHTMTFFGIKGVKLSGLYREENKTFPAELAGMKGGMMITKIDGVSVSNAIDFNREMQKKKPGQNISIEVFDPESQDLKTFNLTLVDKNGRAFMGVYVSQLECIGGLNFYNSKELLDNLKSIPESLKEPVGWFLAISLPFSFQGFTGMENLFDNPPYLFWLLNSLYWIAWINFWVGLFNCLPAIPLDGGRVFHETFSAMLSRRFGDRAEKVSMQIAKFFAVFIFLSLAMMILVPNLKLLGL
ncbi:MAG: site-2 protease family protein [Archaeoglobaceae archaeon]|nr:site-2 protease family protein [Archaeoglobaceae archaeon]MDW8118897.1 site-2 protease family protein [Archaeoglobaceae archaeon]